MLAEPITYRLDEAGYVRLGRAMAVRSMGWIAAIMIILIVIGRAMDFASGEPIDLILPAIIIIAFAVVFFYHVPRRARGIFREQPSMRQQEQLAFWDQGIDITQASGSFRPEWTSFIMWREMAGYILLYVNRAMMIPLPIDKIGEECADYIRHCLATAGLPRAGKRRK